MKKREEKGEKKIFVEPTTGLLYLLDTQWEQMGLGNAA